MPANFKSLADGSVDPPVRGFLHQPTSPPVDGLVLTHGAGGNSQSGLLLAVAEAFAGAGSGVLRWALPFRQARSFGPPHPAGAARDRAGLKNAVAALREFAPGRVFLGGQSYGGPQGRGLVGGEKNADGVLPLSFPFSPPVPPDQRAPPNLPPPPPPTPFLPPQHHRPLDT